MELGSDWLWLPDNWLQLDSASEIVMWGIGTMHEEVSRYR